MKLRKVIEGIDYLIEISSGKEPERSLGYKPKASDGVIKYQHDHNLQDKIVQEFQGLAEGVLADGIVNDQEIEFLKKWSLKRREYLQGFPLSQFFNVVSKGNNEDIRLFLLDMIEDDLNDDVVTTSVIDLINEIEFMNKEFCFTGEFKEHEREVLCEWVVDRGGINRATITKNLDYLVLGSQGSEAWKCGKYGRKIETAVNHRADGFKVKIISEAVFLSNL